MTRKSITIKMDSKNWQKLKAKSNLQGNSLEDEANFMLEKYVEKLECVRKGRN